jgi:hypothetical protein
MTRLNWIVRFAAAPAAGALAVLCALAVPQPARGASAYTLTPTANGMELKTPDGRVVFEYLTKKPEGVPLTAPSAACFHPVNTPSGVRVTNIAPDDHRHHRGIFFGWHDGEFHTPEVVKADFWGWGSLAPRDGRVVQNRELKLVSADDKQAKIAIHNEWLVDGRKMGDEIDSATVTERDTVYVIDLEYRIAPLFEFVAHKNAFSGFDVQCRKDGDSYYSSLYGKINWGAEPNYQIPELNLPDLPWYDFTIKLRDEKKTVGAAVINHLGNGLTTWHLISHLWMLNPVVIAAGPVTIRPGSPLTLRYRVVVHDGPTPTWVIQKLSDEYRGGR